MRIVPLAAAVAAIALGSPATAGGTDKGHVMPGKAGYATTSESTVAIITGECDSLTDGDSAGCSFTGNINTNDSGNSSYLLAQSAYNAGFDPDITLTPLFGADASAFIVGGTQFIANGGGSFTFNLADNLNLDFYAIKGSNEFTLYEYVGGLDNTLTFESSNLSHVVFFVSAVAPVPEPGTWAMMLLGFGAIGFSMRRRRLSVSKRLPFAESLPQVINVETGYLSETQNMLTNG